MQQYINYIVNSKFSKGTEGHINAEDLPAHIQKHNGEEAYYNVFDIDSEALGVDEGAPSFKSANGNCRVALGLVQFDFDSDEIETSYQDVRKFLDYFNFQVSTVCFSGSKGFHVAVPFESFGLTANSDLPKTLRNLAHELKTHFPTIDTSVYNIGRKFRLLNSKHPKTNLYKSIVSGKDLKGLDAILEYCKTRHDDFYPSTPLGLEVNPQLQYLIDNINTSHHYNPDKVGTAQAPTPIEVYDGKVCIKRLIDDRCPEGERNTTALILVNEFFKTQKNKELCLHTMLKWSEVNGLPQEEISTMVEDIYSQTRSYNHGCLDPIKSKKCSAKCSLWPKLSKDKRPVPVDAPKTAYKTEKTSHTLPASEFIRSWLSENMAVVTLANNWFLNGNFSTPVPRNIIEDKIFNASDLVSRKMYKQVSQNRIVSFLNEWENNERDRRMRDLRDHIAFTEPNNLVERYLTAVLSREPSPLEISVLKHWIWLVKRKINQKRTERELMLIVAGITSTGKTQAVSKLFKPVKELVDTMMLDTLADDRNEFRLAANAVIFFDEMASTRKVNVEALKNKITAKWLNYRPLGKTTRVQGRNLASFIGTSNSHVSDIIHDPTSARRYFEYWVDQKCQWDEINSIDYSAMWRGIDENQETTYIAGHVVELVESQENFRAGDSVEEWLDLEELIPDKDDENYAKIPPRDAYNMYMGFMELQRKERFAVSMKRFFNRMGELNLSGRNTKMRFYKLKVSQKPSSNSRDVSIYF